MSENLKDSFMDMAQKFCDKHFGGTNNEGTSVVEGDVTLTKSISQEKRLALFVAMEPDKPDFSGDVASVEEIEKACHSFNTACGIANLYHAIDTEHAQVVQSYTAPQDFELDNGEKITKGTWLVQMHFPETEIGNILWEDVKSGEINGVSIGAHGKATPIED